MQSMNSLFTSAAVTLLAGAIPLVPMSSPVGALIDTIAILIAFAGSALTLMLYFSQDESGRPVTTSGCNEDYCSQ